MSRKRKGIELGKDKAAKKGKKEEEITVAEMNGRDQENHSDEDEDASMSDAATTSSSVAERIRDPTRAMSALRDVANDRDGSLVRAFFSGADGLRPSDLLLPLSADGVKPKASDAAAVFDAVETAFLRLATDGALSDDPKLKSSAVRLARDLLQNHGRFVVLLMSPTNTARQARSALKMLSAMSASHPDVAREILAKVDLDHDNFESLAKRRSQDTAVDVRTSYIHFLLSFLVTGDAGLVRTFLDKKTKFSQIFLGLPHDSCRTVTLVLAVLERRVLREHGVSKTAKMRLLSAHNLRPFLKLLDWKGPKRTDQGDGDDDVEVDEEKREAVAMAAVSFLEAALTSHKHGIVFHDPAVGTSGTNKNHLLLSLLKSLERPWERPPEAGLVASALAVSPDQLRPYLNTLEKVWEPRNSDTWLQVVDYIYTLMSVQDLDIVLDGIRKASSSSSSSSKLCRTVAANLGLPDRLCKEVLLPSLTDESAVVRQKGAELLRMLTSKADEVLASRFGPRDARWIAERWKDRLPATTALEKFWVLETATLSAMTEDVEAKSSAWHGLEHLVDVMDFVTAYYGEERLDECSAEGGELDPEKMLDKLSSLSQDQMKSLGLKMKLLKRLAGRRKLTRDRLVTLVRMAAAAEGEEEAEEAKRVAAGILRKVLADRGLIEGERDACDLGVWLRGFPTGGAEAEEAAGVFVGAVYDHLGDARRVKEAEEATKKYERAVIVRGRRTTAGVGALTAALLASPRVSRLKDTMARAVPALLEAQEYPLPLCRYLWDRLSDFDWLKQDMIPELLGSYQGTLSLADQTRLCLMALADRKSTSTGSAGMSAYGPVSWGQHAASRYGVGDGESKPTTMLLWKVPKVSEVLALVDADKMVRTAAHFPVDLALSPLGDLAYEADDAAITDEPGLYDPRFFLPLLVQVCAPGSYVDKHLALVKSGCLALAVGSLSSRNRAVREAGYLLLTRMYKILELAKLATEKRTWLHLIDLVANGVRASGSKNATSLRLPSVTTVFLVRCCSVLTSAAVSDPMYDAVTQFLLAKPSMDLFRAPEFLRLFYSGNPAPGRAVAERRWILETVRDGTRDGLDFRVLQKDQVVAAVMCHHDRITDEASRAASRDDDEEDEDDGPGEDQLKVCSLVRQILRKAASLPGPAFALVRNHGLMGWVAAHAGGASLSERAESEMLAVVEAAWDAVKRHRKSKKAPKAAEDDEEDEAAKDDDDDEEITTNSEKDATLPDWLFREFGTALESFFPDCGEKAWAERDAAKREQFRTRERVAALREELAAEKKKAGTVQKP